MSHLVTENSWSLTEFIYIYICHSIKKGKTTCICIQILTHLTKAIIPVLISCLSVTAEAVGGVAGLAGKRIKATKHTTATAPNSVENQWGKYINIKNLKAWSFEQFSVHVSKLAEMM